MLVVDQVLVIFVSDEACFVLVGGKDRKYCYVRSGLAYLGSGVLAYGVSGLAYFSVNSMCFSSNKVIVM